MAKRQYTLSRDVLIPAGTRLDVAPAKTVRADKDGNPATFESPPHFVEAIIGPTDDTIFTWTMHIDDALEAGFIQVFMAE